MSVVPKQLMARDRVMARDRGTGASNIATITLCAPCGPGTSLEASAYWDDCGLDQLLFGEWPIGAGCKARLIPDVNTALDDWPCLEDVLRQASLQTAGGWLLLLTAEALPSAALIQALLGFLADQPRPHLLLGRAWRVSAARWATLRSLGSRPEQEIALQTALREEGVLDPPAEISWVLLPRNALCGAPADLSAAPGTAAEWLARRATESGWPVVDATWTAPVVRPMPIDPPSADPSRPPLRGHGVLPAGDRNAPLISLLLVAEPDDLRLGLDRLLPAATLPWQVVVRELADAADGAGVVAAWNDALADAQADLVWPLWNGVPKLGAIPALLRCFEPAWVDLVSTGFRIGAQRMPANDPAQVPPGTLVLRRQWLDLLAGFPAARSAAHGLLRLRSAAVARGATVHPLPIEVLEG